VVLDDHSTLQLLLKYAGRHAPSTGVRAVTPSFVRDPTREIEAYRLLLRHEELGTARCHAGVIDRGGERCWLLLERVPGVPLWQVGEIACWQGVAAALARMHERLADRAAEVLRIGRPPLLVHDGAYCRRWLERARRFGAAGEQLAHVAAAFERVQAEFLALPSGVIHGEFYASNVLVARSTGGLRVCAVDWEMAAIGPTLIDLAALTAGAWSQAQRRSIALSYRAALSPQGRMRAPVGQFLRALDLCRLQICLQWLGWSRAWTPPAEHAHDWLTDALATAERLAS